MTNLSMLGKLALGVAALGWVVSGNAVAAHGGGGHGGGHSGGGHSGGGYHGGGYHGGGYNHGGYNHGGYNRGGYGGYGYGGYGYGYPYLYGYPGYGGYYSGYGNYNYGNGYNSRYSGYYPGDYQQSPPPIQVPAAATVNVAVQVPAGAEVWFDGVKTTQTGNERLFVSPPLEPGYSYQYEIRARWLVDGAPVTQTRRVSVLPGEQYSVNFLRTAPLEP